MLGLEELRKQVNVVVLIIPNDIYGDWIIKISKEASEVFDRICYVSLNKLSSALKQFLKASGVQLEKFLFVDAVTRSVMPNVGDTEDCKYVSSAAALEEMGIVIGQELVRGIYSALIFDSLSTLRIYNSDEVVTRFAHTLINRLRLANCFGIFTCLEADTETNLIRNVEMFCDRVLKLR